MEQDNSPLVGVIMGSKSDWPTMEPCASLLRSFEVAHECRVVSAHRTPALLAEYASSAEGRGLQVIIAGAGGAAHLPGMVAAESLLPVIGVPIAGRTLRGVDSLLSIVQMPRGVPVATMSIGEAGATNAALCAIAILAGKYPALRGRLREFRAAEAQRVLAETLP
ncbi:MAG TPA: 5-(carboxyamino)imidazole ribonucleotide mutase [Nannocystis exedens]|nr:5-(carboxyamino)imidazole ribonucleotide mutase [Nannocystis exedens]